MKKTYSYKSYDEVKDLYIHKYQCDITEDQKRVISSGVVPFEYVLWPYEKKGWIW